MDRTVGIEEEFLLFRPSSPRLVPAGDDVLAAIGERSDGQFEHELKQEQLELGTHPHSSMEALLSELQQRRAELAEGARQQGARVVALGTSPLDTGHTATTDRRYERMMATFGRLGRVQLTCGLHVHVEAAPDEGVGVVDRLRPWLPVLVALSANSPYFAGEDTGYASYRSMLWGQWPTAGPTELFGDHAGYERARRDLVASGAAMDDGMLYFDARLSAHYPTVEVRVADVCPYAGDAVTLAALTRALVATTAEAWGRGHPPPDVRTGTLRAAAWRAARFGLEEELFDPVEGHLLPAWELVDRLVSEVEGALERSGDLSLVTNGLQQIRDRGNGARLQREAFRRDEDFGAVISAVAQVTACAGDLTMSMEPGHEP